MLDSTWPGNEIQPPGSQSEVVDDGQRGLRSLMALDDCVAPSDRIREFLGLVALP